MMAYYLQKGHSLGELVNLSTTEKLFFIAAMEIEAERRAKMYGK